MVKHLPTVPEMWVQTLGQADLLEKEMATHSSILAWKIQWTEEPGGLQSTGSQGVGHDWANSLSLHSRERTDYMRAWIPAVRDLGIISEAAHYVHVNDRWNIRPFPFVTGFVSPDLVPFFFFFFNQVYLFCNLGMKASWRYQVVLFLSCKALYGGGGGLVAKSCLTLATPWTVARQAPLSVGFPRQEYWIGLPFPSPKALYKWALNNQQNVI